MKQSPRWEANNSLSASQEIPYLLWKTEVSILLLIDRILTEINRIHIFTPCFFKIDTNIILHPRLILPSCLLLSAFSTEFIYPSFFVDIHSTRPVHFILFDLIEIIIFHVQYIWIPYMYSCLQPPVWYTSPNFHPYTFSSDRCFQTLSLNVLSILLGLLLLKGKFVPVLN
jgi:hypothetical protein